MENKYKAKKVLLFKLLDEAQVLEGEYSGGYSTTFLSAEEFHIALKESIIKLKNGDLQQLNRLHIWFAPTCSWDDFVGNAGIELGNEIYELVNEILNTEKNITSNQNSSKEANEKSKIQIFLNWLFGKKFHLETKDSDEFNEKYEKTNTLFINCLKNYNSEFCQCAFPRFHQITGIDCAETSHSFKCWETELLINLSKAYFDIDKSNLTDECVNEIWTCKKCKSTYEYGWSDFSISMNRQNLKPIELKTKQIGKSISTPIPLYLGFMGHSFPRKKIEENVTFEEFENYMNEK